jgi:hypothetical protein
LREPATSRPSVLGRSNNAGSASVQRQTETGRETEREAESKAERKVGERQREAEGSNNAEFEKPKNARILFRGQDLL